MSSETITLEELILKTQLDDPDPTQEYSAIFAHEDKSQPRYIPTLRRDRRNTILSFRGCFNPLHNGHLEVIKHVFLNAGDDLNLIAVMVTFVPDAGVARKNPPFVLSRAQRRDLWLDVADVSQWAVSADSCPVLHRLSMKSARGGPP